LKNKNKSGKISAQKLLGTWKNLNGTEKDKFKVTMDFNKGKKELGKED